MICAVWLHPVATWQFGLFLLGDCLWLLVPLILGILLSLLFLSGQRSAEYVKGKVPKRGIYITNTLAKAAFLIFILYSSVSRGIVLTKGTMEPPMRSRP